MKNVKFLLVGVVLGSALAMGACVVYPPHEQGHGYGPPPHAPAHGYRYKYEGHDLEYDANLGVYIVLGITGLYFLDEYYYRHDHDGWYYSPKYDKDWKRFENHDRNLPPGLAKKYQDDDGDRDRGRGRDDDQGRGGGDRGRGHDN